MENDVTVTEEKERKKPRVKRRKAGKRILIGAVFASLLLLAYLSSVYYFSRHYFYKTRINGEDCSFLSDSEVRGKINQKISLYELKIIGKDGVTDTISADDIGLKFVYDESLMKVRELENPFLWFMAFLTGYDFELPDVADYDEVLFEKKVKSLAFYDRANIKKAKNAYIGNYSETEGAFVIVEEEDGSEPDDSRMMEVLSEKIKGLQEVVYLEIEGCYKQAEIIRNDSDLIKELDILNSYVTAKITYDWNGETEVVDGRLISEWLIRSGKKVSLDEEKVAEFVAQKAKEHDTYGRDRSFTTTDGRELELKSGGFGWLTARAETAEELIAAIQKGEVTEKEPIYSCTGAQKGKDDVGSSYVEIDLGTQHLYLYIDGEIMLESDLVSGNVQRGWTTPPGVFGITYKTKNAVLRGETYETPVDYWMPFNGNIGMHDATWRGSFGGDIYLTNGSHGCINLPHDAAAQIYEYMSKGFPVVCYY
ncbi:MAG: L,D-transpeptidase/peptidoglycan binding protein [Lachnospiraceae bacterium]|nr:L,D-transpeptidase/peptidoglycan binding protein [Lachnospiraceae bacterium]